MPWQDDPKAGQRLFLLRQIWNEVVGEPSVAFKGDEPPWRWRGASIWHDLMTEHRVYECGNPRIQKALRAIVMELAVMDEAGKQINAAEERFGALGSHEEWNRELQHIEKYEGLLRDALEKLGQVCYDQSTMLPDYMELSQAHR